MAVIYMVQWTQILWKMRFSNEIRYKRTYASLSELQHNRISKNLSGSYHSSTKWNKLLLSKYAGREYVHYALIAGFTEIGETIEETVKREVMEEVGLKVKNLHFYKSQPWSFPEHCYLDFSVIWMEKIRFLLMKKNFPWQSGWNVKIFRMTRNKSAWPVKWWPSLKTEKIKNTVNS